MSATPTKRHRVLVLENELGMGGSEKLLYDFISRFDRSRFWVGVCCLKNGGYWKDRIVELGIPFYENILRHKFDALAFRKLARILREEEVDLIDTYAHPNTVILSYFAKAFGLAKRFVVAFHATGNLEGGRLVPTYLKPFLGGADALIALADRHRRYLVEKEGLHEKQMVVIHNGVDTERFRPPSGNGESDMRGRFGIDADDFVLTTVASLKPVKKIDLFLNAAAGVVRARRDVRVLLVGDGPDRGRLQSIAGQLGIEDRVIFAGMRDDVDRVLRMSDALVLSSRTEALPTAVLEAMATGLPVVATDVGSVRDMVEDGRSAFVVPPGDRDALSQAISALVADRERARSFGERGRRIVLERFSVGTMVENRQRLFERLISAAPLPG
jgi:glycosyltransferase involved in cell wall biosynthesis